MLPATAQVSAAAFGCGSKMATGWLKGTVKAVNSGDVLVIVGAVKSGPPPEKTLTLSSLIAPRLVSHAP